MACPMECNVLQKTNEKLQNYGQLAYEFFEKRPGYNVSIVPLVIGCLGAGVSSFTKYARKIIQEDKLLERTTQDMVQTVVFHSETIMRKVLSGLIQPLYD